MLDAAERRANLARVVDGLPQRVQETSLACCCACHSMVRRLLSSPLSGYASGGASFDGGSSVPQSEVVGCCGDDAPNRKRLVLEHDDSAYGGAYARNYSDGSEIDDSFHLSSDYPGCSPCNGHVLDPDAEHLLCAEDFMDAESEDEADIDTDIMSEGESDGDVKPYGGFLYPDVSDEYKEYSDSESDTRSVVVLRVVPGYVAEEQRRKILAVITNLE